MKNRKTNKEVKEVVFLGLTRMHRDIVQRKKINIYKIFKEVGYNSPRQVKLILDFLFENKIIRSTSKGQYTWNGQKTCPTMEMVNYIVDTYYKNHNPRPAKREKTEKAIQNVAKPIVEEIKKDIVLDLKGNTGKTINLCFNIQIVL